MIILASVNNWNDLACISYRAMQALLRIPWELALVFNVATYRYMSKEDFRRLSLSKKIQKLYTEGTFVVGIRYYAYKINLYLLGADYVEVFYNHKYDRIDKIDFLNHSHTRMKFYLDQINLEEI